MDDRHTRRVKLDQELIEVLLRALPLGELDADDEAAWARRAEALAEIATEDIETAMIAGETGLNAEFRGIGGYREAWSDWLSPFAEYRSEVEEMHETPDGLLFFTRQWVTPRGSTGTIEGEGAGVLRFAERKLRRIEFHLDRVTARRAAGLA